MSLNKVMLIGRLGKDPETKTLNGGNTVCNFSMATSEKFTDKQGQKQENTEWHNIVLWGKQAELAGQYLRKGSNIYLEGSIKTEIYEKDGQTKYVTRVTGRQMQFLDKKDDSQQQQQGGQQQQQAQNHNTGGLPVEDELPF